MKKSVSFLFIIALFITNFSSGQGSFKVIKVNGQIVMEKNGQALVNGLSFSEKEKLLFKTPGSKAAVISSTKGRMILTANQGNKSGANYLPAMSNVSTRGGALINSIDLKNHFSGNYVILDKVDIQINSPDFPMDDKNFFYLRYKYKDEDINKKLAFEANNLIIDRKELFTIDGKPIPNPEVTEMTLFYFKDNNSSVRIGEFNPVFPKLDVLKEEIQVILDEYKDKSSKEKIAEVTSYINDFYGKPNVGNLKIWMEENFEL